MPNWNKELSELSEQRLLCFRWLTPSFEQCDPKCLQSLSKLKPRTRVNQEKILKRHGNKSTLTSLLSLFGYFEINLRYLKIGKIRLDYFSIQVVFWIDQQVDDYALVLYSVRRLHLIVAIVAMVAWERRYDYVFVEWYTRQNQTCCALLSDTNPDSDMKP